MTDALTYKGEALLLSWSDSTAGRKVTFLLPDEGTEHPFKGHKTGPKYGQAFAIGCAPVDYDNPEPAKPGDPVKSVKGYAKPPMTESQRCGMLCHDKAFQAFLAQAHPEYWAHAGREWENDPVERAAATIRQALCIMSRRELDNPNSAATAAWLYLVAAFDLETGRLAERTR